ncbi:MAG: hypothetical protein RR133_05605 [Kiritimatiellia bacterium]
MMRAVFFLVVLGTFAVATAAPKPFLRSEGPNGFSLSSVSTERARFLETPLPLQSRDGCVYVGCVTPERAPLRWPVLKFVDTVRNGLEREFIPLGVSQSPLSIVLGAETNAVTTVERRVIRSNGFSQLVIRVPNPETVDLDVFRVAIAEALLREKARALGGDYAALQWPQWFIRAVMDGARNNDWKSAAYEVMASEVDANRLPDVAYFFSPGISPNREVASFFAQWVLTSCRRVKVEDLAKFLTVPWEKTAVLGSTTNAEWNAYVQRLSTVVFVPGTLTLPQLRRWRTALVTPRSVEEALQIAQSLPRASIGRPTPLRDLAILYAQAYATFARGELEMYREQRHAADEAADFLEQHLKRIGTLLEAPVPIVKESAHE